VQPDRPVQTTLAFHASRIVTDVGVLIAMAAMSLTFVSTPDGGRSALSADALPAVLLLLPIFAITMIPDHTRPLHPALGWGSMVLALAALPYAFVKLLDARILADTLGGSLGLGPIVLLLGCIVTLIGIGIGIARDLAGKPSGGTPQRGVAYESRRQRAAAAAPESAVGPDSGPPAAAGRDGGTSPAPAETVADPSTRVLAAPPGDEADPSIDDPDGEDATEIEDDGGETPPPETEQPEIVFPDTGAVVREAEPVEAPQDDLLDTAERADVALDESLISLFDPHDVDEDLDEETP
jgi:hypothetical protein